MDLFDFLYNFINSDREYHIFKDMHYATDHGVNDMVEQINRIIKGWGKHLVDKVIATRVEDKMAIVVIKLDKNVKLDF